MLKDFKKIIFLTIIMVVVWANVSKLSMDMLGYTVKKVDMHDNLIRIGALVLVCFFNALVANWYLKRSKLSGYKLFLMVFIIVFGIMFFMTQIETMYFNYAIKMPSKVILSVLITGFVVALIISLFCVKLKKENGLLRKSRYVIREDRQRKRSFILKIFILAIIYVVFYFVFGYFIAWQFGAVREFYSKSTDIVPFLAHMKNQLLKDYWLFAFQFIRGIMWSIIGYLVARSIATRGIIEKYILTALVLSIGLCTPLLIPNDYMPYGVRFGHFFELLIENFLFGLIVVGFFNKE